MAISFPIPEVYVGQPVEMEGVILNPFRDLDNVSGCDDSDPNIAALGTRTREMQKKMLAITGVTRGNLADCHGEDIRSLTTRLMARLTPNGGCFVMGEEGADLYMGSRESLLRELPLQIVGGFGAGVTDGLESRRELLGDLTARHLATDIALLDLPKGALLIETGAGADYERLRLLRDHALSRGSRFVAHDPTPAAARDVSGQVEGIPYLALPHRREFLAETLKDAQGPKVITLQNVISSMAFGTIDELLTVAGLIEADRMVISQSLAVSQYTNMIPDGFHAGERGRESYILERLMREGLIGPTQDQRKTNFTMTLVSMQARNTMEMLLMEIARMQIQIGASKISNMPHNRTLISEQNKEMDPGQARAWLEKFRPGLLLDFERGTFNTLTTGPFGERCAKEPDVPGGELRLKSIRFTLELSRQPLSAPQFPSQRGQVVRRCDPKDFVTPKELRKDDPLASYGLYLQRLHAQGQSIDLEEAQRTLDIKGLLKLGAALGHEMLFRVCGQQAGIPHIAQHLGSKENHMYREFVNL